MSFFKSKAGDVSLPQSKESLVFRLADAERMLSRYSIHWNGNAYKRDLSKPSPEVEIARYGTRRQLAEDVISALQLDYEIVEEFLGDIEFVARSNRERVKLEEIALAEQRLHKRRVK